MLSAWLAVDKKMYYLQRSEEQNVNNHNNFFVKFYRSMSTFIHSIMSIVYLHFQNHNCDVFVYCQYNHNVFVLLYIPHISVLTYLHIYSFELSITYL